MTANEAIAAVLERDIQMLQWHLGDFTDADMLARPVAAPTTPPGSSAT